MSGVQQHSSVIDDAWDSVVGGFHWLKSVLLGEFEDNRPLSAIIADMLVSFIPAVVIATSARDAIAVILRMARHPEKREEELEWVLLCACLITIALPLAMAAAGAAAAGVGAVVGGIAGSELGAALRAVMLLLVKASTKLVDIIHFLQRFIRGDILKFLRAIKFAKYNQALLSAVRQFTGKLIDITRGLAKHLESLSYFQYTRNVVAKLRAWERSFYAVQTAAVRKIPLAMAELDVRLAKVLAETLPRETHTVPAGVRAPRQQTATPARQHVRDVPGQILRHGDEPAARAAAKPTTGRTTPPKKTTPPPKPPEEKPPLKDKADDVPAIDGGANTRKQDVARAKVAADAKHVKQLSDEAASAEKRGDPVTRDAKIEEAQSYLKKEVLDNPNIPAAEKPQALIDRLDVSSPKDKAVFWSGNKGEAQKFAKEIEGVTLETTNGGRIVDEWPELKTSFPGWDKDPPPNGYQFWTGLSEKYAQGASGDINVVQSAKKAAVGGGDIWKGHEYPKIEKLQDQGIVGSISYSVVGDL